MANNARLRVSLSFLWFVAAAEPGRAAADLPSKQDVQVIGRVLKFQEDRKSDTLRIAVAYNPDSPASYREAAALVQFIGSGQTVGSLTLSGVLVEQGKVGGLGGYDAVFSAAGTDLDRLGSAVRQHAVPCITREIDQVSSGACIIAIQTSPATAIYFSSANAAAAGVRFATAFIMMVREI